MVKVMKSVNWPVSIVYATFTVLLAAIPATASYFKSISDIRMEIRDSITTIRKESDNRYTTKEIGSFLKEDIREIKKDVKDIKNILIGRGGKYGKR